MRKAALILLTFLFTVPLFAEDKHQSYIAYDDGGSVVKQADDGREIEARVNMPVYPGDEVVTNRRGRSEIRLSDGNVLGVDRASSIYFRSILDSYEGEASQTVAELRFGKVAVHRTELGRDTVRIDTTNASYVAREQAVYSVETDPRGKDRVTVFDGSIEVRTRSRATRLREGEAAEVDERGVYDLVSDAIASSDDFERWFVKRAERRDGRSNNRYLDRRLGYWADDLDDHGNWVHVNGVGWSWRPYVAVGWRPYYHGHWYTSRNGCLTWVSYDPFGWLPYHYGRWAYDPFHGWIWVPGYGYSPAWVYWWYSPGYVGWAPAGWWDCHRGYYDWAYRPYSRAGLDIGFGFYGRVRIDDIDLRPWTFIDANNIVSNRVDRAALTMDAAKQRLARVNGGLATISSDPARFTREEFRNPAAAINRRAVGGGFGRDTGATTGDVTPFIRRDNDLNATVRDRVVRGRVSNPSAPAATTPARGAGSGVAPIDGNTGLAPIGRGSIAPIGGGGVAPIGTGIPAPVDGGRVNRGGTGTGTSGSTGDDAARGSRGDTGRINRGGSEAPVTTRRPVEVVPPAEPDRSSRGTEDSSWRDRLDRSQRSEPEKQPETKQNDTPPPPPSTSDRSWRDRGSESSGSGSDVPRRVIERSSGTRLTPRNVDNDSGSRSTGSSTRSGSGSTDRSRSTSTRDSSDRSSRSSGSGGRVYVPRSGGGSSSGSSGGSSSSGSSGSSGGSSSSSGSSGSSNSGSGSRSEGGQIKRDQ